MSLRLFIVIRPLESLLDAGVRPRPFAVVVDMRIVAVMRGSPQHAQLPVSRRSPGHTLIELAVVCALAAIIAGIAVPSVVASHGCVAGSVASRQLAIVLREAQARAQVSGDVVRVIIDADGQGYSVDAIGAFGESRVASGEFGGARCSSNYPGNAVEFAGAGWPRALGAGVRAGTFRLTASGHTRSVVLQMGGAIRCR